MRPSFDNVELRHVMRCEFSETDNMIDYCARKYNIDIAFGYDIYLGTISVSFFYRDVCEIDRLDKIAFNPWDDMAHVFKTIDDKCKTILDFRQPQKELPTKPCKSYELIKCQCCGATLHTSKCEYCGTIYREVF